MDSKHQDIPFEPDVGEPGTPYIEEVTIPRGKTLDVIHGADPSWPADRNPKFSAKRGNTSKKRKELCERLCGRNNNSGPLNTLTTAHHEEAPVLPYSDYRVIPIIGPVDPASSGGGTGPAT